MNDVQRLLGTVAGIFLAGMVALAVSNFVTAGAFVINLTLIVAVVLILAGFVLFIIKSLISSHENQLEELAMTDSLTGVAGRNGFEIISNQLFRSVERRKVTLSVLLLGVDDFKRINDTYGHAGGDAVLRDIVDVIRQRFRKSDLIFRWGGDEFLILAPECDMAEAERLAQAARQAINEHETPFEGRNIKVSVSGGVAERRADENEADLITRADHALIAAKNGGRNRIESAG